MSKILEVKDIILKYKVIQTQSLKKAALNRFRGNKKSNNEFVAINGISFDVFEGDTIGIVGNNGAGKSTLLRLLAGIFQPDSGNIINHSTTCSLLALGTGFVNELSGIENIYLSGLLQGLSKKQIDDRLNEIIDFSGIGDSVYQPVRTYSTGMRARLSFSISSHIDPDILLIDELLGVGDRDFKKKSGDKIREMINDDRTVLLVSHNLETVKELCNKVLWLEKGEIKMYGSSEDVINAYNQ